MTHAFAIAYINHISYDLCIVGIPYHQVVSDGPRVTWSHPSATMAWRRLLSLGLAGLLLQITHGCYGRKAIAYHNVVYHCIVSYEILVFSYSIIHI